MKLSFKYFHNTIVASLVAIATTIPLATNALDLPIKNVNGIQYYFREVKPKETIYGLCRELGLSKDEIVRHNPSVGDGLKAGMTLYFPVNEFNSGERIPPHPQQSRNKECHRNQPTLILLKKARPFMAYHDIMASQKKN